MGTKISLFIFLSIVFNCNAHVPILGDLISGAHSVLGEIAHGLNVNIGGRLDFNAGSNKQPHPEFRPDQHYQNNGYDQGHNNQRPYQHEYGHNHYGDGYGNHHNINRPYGNERPPHNNYGNNGNSNHGYYPNHGYKPNKLPNYQYNNQNQGNYNNDYNKPPNHGNGFPGKPYRPNQENNNFNTPNNIPNQGGNNQNYPGNSDGHENNNNDLKPNNGGQSFEPTTEFSVSTTNKITQKPDTDVPLFVPLNPNETGADSGKTNTDPKREAETAEDEDFEIDIRIKNE